MGKRRISLIGSARRTKTGCFCGCHVLFFKDNKGKDKYCRRNARAQEGEISGCGKILYSEAGVQGQ